MWSPPRTSQLGPVLIQVLVPLLARVRVRVRVLVLLRVLVLVLVLVQVIVCLASYPALPTCARTSVVAFAGARFGKSVYTFRRCLLTWAARALLKGSRSLQHPV